MPYTSNKKPSGLDAASSVAASDVLVIEKSGSVQRTTAADLATYAFATKGVAAANPPSGSEALVVRDGATLKDVTLANILPNGVVTDAKVSSNTGDRISGSKVTPNFGSQNIVTTGGTSTGTLSASSNTTIGGNLQVTGTITATGGITNSTVVSGTAATANQLTTARNITAGPTGDVSWTVSFNGSTDVSAAATISSNVVTDAKLRSSGACSVIGRSANTTGNVADIQASADDQILRRASGSLGFGQVTAGMIATDAVTTVKLQNDSVTADKLADDASTDANRAVTTNHIRDLAVTTGKVADLAVTNGKIANSTIELGKLVAAVQQALVPVGAVEAFARSTAPSGWLAANGNTIGAASSGANNASADYSALFTVLWDNWSNTDLPILDSAGAASTRGASAAADFSANKRLPLPDLRGIFVRGSGSQTISGTTYSATFGAKQQDDFKSHTHYETVTSAVGISRAGGGGGFNAVESVYGQATSATGGTETRPANIALLYCIKF